MGETRIFAMPDSGNGGGGTNGLLAMLPALMQQRGLDPNILALVVGHDVGVGACGFFGRGDVGHAIGSHFFHCYAVLAVNSFIDAHRASHHLRAMVTSTALPMNFFWSA